MTGDIQIGKWLVQPRINSMESDGEVRHLEPKVMQVLTTLATHPGEVVTRDQLRLAVWPDVSVGEDVLIRAVGEIRRAFGDDVRSPHTVQTVPKVGYRLIAPVCPVLRPEPDRIPGPSSAEAVEVSTPLEVSKRRRGIRLISVVSTLLLICLCCAGVYSFFRRSKALSTDFTSHPLTTDPGQELQPSFSPDGQSVAFVWHKLGDDQGHIYIKAISSEAAVRLLDGTDGEFSPTWSPDGHTIALLRQDTNSVHVETVAASGGTERQLYTLPVDTIWEYGGIAWTEDGESLIFPQRRAPDGPSELVRLNLASRAISLLTTPKSGWDGDWMPNVSPDGKLLSFTRGSERSARDLWVMELPAGTPRRITVDNRLIVGTSWTSDGSSIVFASNRLGSMALWRVSLHGGVPERELAGTENAYGPTIARRGDRLAYTHGNAEWSIVQSEIGKGSSNDLQLLGSTEQDSAPALSPDGKVLAFQSWRSGGQEIWISASNGTRPVQLTQTGNFSGSPSWSPTGDRIAYDARIGGFARVCVMGAHGANPHPMLGGSFDDIVPSWSSDGAWLYFGSNRSDSWQIWRTPSDGSGTAQQVTANGGMVAKESPDGKWIYYTKRGQNGLWRRASSGGNETKVSNAPPDGYQDYWIVDEHGIVYIDWQDGNYVLLRFDPNNNKTELLYKFTHPVTPFAGIAVFPDGKRIIHAELTRAESTITLIDNFH